MKMNFKKDNMNVKPLKYIYIFKRKKKNKLFSRINLTYNFEKKKKFKIMRF